MRWQKVDRTLRVQPKAGDYNDWKDQVASECGNRCVYCAVSEGRFGGRRNYHVDHFRPKSKFADLRKTIHNLYLSCCVCNCFKSDHWPAEPTNDHSVEAFIDPSDFDYNELFAVSATTYEVASKCVAGAYVVEQLFLNRPHLISERRLAILLEEMAARQDAFDEVIEQLFDSDATDARALLQEVLATTKELRSVIKKLVEAVPYRSEDLKRK